MEDRYSLSSEVQKLIESENFSGAAKLFFNEQVNSWDQLKAAYKSLASVQIKTFWFENFKIYAQHNPNRIKSTTAEVEDNLESTDNCFLCEKNLPAKQSGIILPGNYVLLCNPFPIFPEHFTIPKIQHQPQQIKNSFDDLLTFSKMFGKSYSLIYNGPKCGASAPYHLHFQMGSKNFVPIENDIQQIKNDFGKVLVEREEISIFAIDDKCRKIIFIESLESELIQQTFELIYKELNIDSSENEEPMLNILSYYNEEFGWGVIIFLREKHRPDIYFKSGENKMLVSPAAIDFGGVLILPGRKDFEKINAETIQNIFSEVSTGEEKFFKLSENLSKKFKRIF